MGKTEKKAGKSRAAKAETKKIEKPAPARVVPAPPSVAAPVKPVVAGIPIAIPSFAPPTKPKNPATEFVLAALAGVDPDANFGVERKKLPARADAWWLEGDWDNCTVGAFVRYAATRS